MTSGYAITTLVVYITFIFLIRPISTPAPGLISQIPLNLATTPILAIALLWVTQCLDLAVIRNGIVGTDGIKPYSVLILFFSLAYMAISLDLTGILQMSLFWVSSKSGRNGWKLYLYFYVTLTLFSILLGNDPVIISGTVFLAHYTQVAGLEWKSWVMAEFAAVSTAGMVLFVGNPANVIICEGFSVNNATFTAYTILPFAACSIFCFAALAFQFRNQVPQRLASLPRQGPGLAVLDRLGAWVGSTMLGATLLICLVVSFFGIDPWMISLPFAIIKFIFDIGWDHYRYSHCIPMMGREIPQGSVDEDSAVEGNQSTEGPPSRRHPPTRMHRALSLPIMPRDAEGPSLRTLSLDEEQARPSFLHIFSWPLSDMAYLHDRLDRHFPTPTKTLSHLPFALVPLIFSHFILVEVLNHQGWIDVFAHWLVRVSHKQMHPTIWLVGVLGVVLCNLMGTQIGATILLTRVVRAAALPYDVNHAASMSLAVATNIGAMGFTFSASLAGLLLQTNLEELGISMRQGDFAFWNLLPLFLMTIVGLGIVSVEMKVLFYP